MKKGYITSVPGHCYCIHPKKSEEVALNKDDMDSHCDIVFISASIGRQVVDQT